MLMVDIFFIIYVYSITGKPGRGNFVSARAGNEGWRIVQGNVGREWETFTAIPNP